MDMSTKETSEMFDPSTSTASPAIIFSPALLDGPAPFVSPEFPMTSRSGPDRALVNLSARQAKEKGLLTSAISGPRGPISSASTALSEFLGSRLRARMDIDGSTLFTLTWKDWVTPAGRRFSLLRASKRRTNGIESGSWPTPTAMDGNRGNLPPRPWDKGVPLTQIVAQRETFPTPTARDWRSEKALPEFEAKRNAHTRGKTLAYIATIYPTPTANRWSGLQTHGVNVVTGLLNPAWVAWLQGYPAEWISCAPSAIASSRKLRRNSSKQPLR